MGKSIEYLENYFEKDEEDVLDTINHSLAVYGGLESEVNSPKLKNRIVSKH